MFLGLLLSGFRGIFPFSLLLLLLRRHPNDIRILKQSCTVLSGDPLLAPFFESIKLQPKASFSPLILSLLLPSPSHLVSTPVLWSHKHPLLPLYT
ncbi:hypothetical protein CPSG_10209 [Coccidioides posadasii str. Silveira]|uniref:Uncharacterized protein n=1 Tax=Coccidioides posadasii (strain RMSCC 757 / Silveira) TaxID=443226 RepID=E9DK60_COCPS|nr:hypothetical protein CPSG_10209 [Coccidioides posadasii str. Silveira]